MPFVQNTEADVKVMLEAIGVESIEELFNDIPTDMRVDGLLDLPTGLSEADVVRQLREFVSLNRVPLENRSFLGAGIERHFIPHVVDHISLDGNFITAYTPYQPEVSQGTLTAIFEFQSMLSALTGLGVSNASLYDGASATVEAALVAFHWAQKKHRKDPRTRLLVPRSLHPEYRQTLATYIAGNDAMEVIEIPFDPQTGKLDRATFDEELEKGAVVGALLPYPNFFGVVEDLQPYADALHKHGATAIAVAHPLSLGLLKSPGELGCDIAVGEGQPLGCYQAFGGPAFGYFSCTQEYIRFAPGRIVSETVDVEGNRAFCLALATREQHIRREKATSNICTNQALMALRAAIYLASLGKQGIVGLARQIASAAHFARQSFAEAGVACAFEGSHIFNEFVVRVPEGVDLSNSPDAIQPGYDLGATYPELERHQLINVSELHQKTDVEALVSLFTSKG